MDAQKIEAAIEMARSAACNLDVIEKWHPSVTGNPIFALLRAQLRSAIDYLEGGDGELRLPSNAQSEPPAESGSAIADARRIAALPELLGAADNALGVLIASVIPAGGADDKAAILDAQMQVRAAIAKVTGNDA